MGASRQLCVEIGPLVTTAVQVQAGHAVPVLHDGSPLLPSGVHVAADAVTCGVPAAVSARATPEQYLADPMTALATGDPLAPGAVAALLTYVAHAAGPGGPVEALTLVVPVVWGPRRHGLVRQAATEAGFPRVELIAHPVAVAQRLAATQTIPTAGYLLIADTDRATVTVLQPGAHGWEVRAMQERPAATTRGAYEGVLANVVSVDDTLARRLSDPVTSGDAGERLALLEQVHGALTDLHTAGQAAVVMPAGHPPRLVTRGDAATAVAPLAVELVEAALLAVEVADIDPGDLTGVVVCGGGWYADQVAARLETALGHAPTVLGPGQAAAVHGAAGSPADTLEAVSLRQVPRPGIRSLLAILTPALASWILLPHTLARGMELMPYRPYDTRFGQAFDLFFNKIEFALAGMFITVATIACGQYVASALQADAISRGQPASRAHQTGRFLASTAGFGFALAALYGLLGGAILTQVPTERFLQWTLAAAAAPAVITAAAGLLSPHLPGLRPLVWAERLRPPVLPVVLATAGILSAEVSDTSRRWMWFHLPRFVFEVITTLNGPVGAGLLCAAIAVTLAARRWTRVVFGVLAGLGGAITYSFHNLSAVETIFLIVAALWWVLRGLRIAGDALPLQVLHTWWRSLNSTPASQSAPDGGDRAPV